MTNKPQIKGCVTNDVPEEIWIDHIDFSKTSELAGWWDCSPENGVKYIRADLHKPVDVEGMSYTIKNEKGKVVIEGDFEWDVITNGDTITCKRKKNELEKKDD